MFQYNAFCLAAISSGSGKTTLSLGLMRALRRRGVDVRPFKSGPDYIDPEFHKSAAKADSINLDLWMAGEEGVRRSFRRRLGAERCAVVEGVMGLFDGVSPSSIEGSTAQLAKTLDIPVVLVVDASGMAGTIAALVSGCAAFVPGLKVAGVIANFVSTPNHKRILAEALSSRGLPPLLGTLPPNDAWKLPERHLGLVPEVESVGSDAWYEALADGVERNVDLDALLAATRLESADSSALPPKAPSKVRLAVARDEAFHFYYPDNLLALEARGVELASFSPMRDSALPSGVNGVYVGGGYPELFAKILEGNVSMRSELKAFAESGRPLYAECGGLMYLCRSLQDADGAAHEMCGVFPYAIEMGRKLRRLGYRLTRTLKDSPLGLAGTLYRGHEFHWSQLAEEPKPALDAAESKGARAEAAWEPSALSYKGVYASYVHAYFAFDDALLDNFVATLEKAAPWSRA